MGSQLTEGVVVVNNEGVGIVPNSLKFGEGLGEQKQLPESFGGGEVVQVFANDLSTAIGRVSFDMRTTIPYIKLLREWKRAGNGNTVQLSLEADGETLQKTFSNAALVGDYDVEIGTETVITVEWTSDTAK